MECPTIAHVPSAETPIRARGLGDEISSTALVVPLRASTRKNACPVPLSAIPYATQRSGVVEIDAEMTCAGNVVTGTGSDLPRLAKLSIT
jgi:hypothetical protein